MSEMKTMSNGVEMTVHVDGSISMQAKRQDREFVLMDPKFVAALKEHFTGELTYVKPPDPEYTDGVYKDVDGDLWIYQGGLFHMIEEDGSVDIGGDRPAFVVREYGPLKRYAR